MAIPEQGGIVTGSHTIDINTNSYGGWNLYMEVTDPNNQSSTGSTNTNKDANLINITQQSSTNNPYTIVSLPETATAVPSFNASGNTLPLEDSTWGIAMPYGGYVDDFSPRDNYTSTDQDILKDTKWASPKYMSSGQQWVAARDGKPSAAYPDTRTIYYGVRVDNPSTTPAGDYKAGIVYTAIANLPPAPNEADITITPTTHRVDKDPDPNTNPSTLTITGSNLASTYKVQLQSTNPANITTTNTSNGTTTTNNNPIYTCTNPKVATDSTNTATNPDSAIDTVTCIIPGRESNAESGVANITTIDTIYPYNVIITTQGGTVTNPSAFSYTKLLSINSVAYGEDESEDESQTITMDITIDYDQHLIPVVYTGTDDKAEWSVVTNQELQENPNNWFNYSSTEKRWANAVTVKPDTLTKYLNIMTGYVNPDTNPDQGTNTNPNNKVVAEEDILGYWVYIPRYAYEVQRPNAVDKVVSAQNFNIRFETTGDTKKTPATTCNNLNPTKEEMWKNGNTSGNNSQGASDPNNLAKDYREQCTAPGNTNGPDGTEITRDYPDNDAELANGHTTWATHPAFTWSDGTEAGTIELNGFWIGKFELTGKITEPTVLPNSFANVGNYIGEYWISIASMGVKDNNNTGGGSNRNSWNKTLPNGETINQSIDDLKQNSHNLTIANSTILKNDQWGAVTYLSASQYGAGVNKVYNNAAGDWYYIDGNRLYQMATDDDGDNVTNCYYSKKKDYPDTGTQDTVISCFIGDDGQPLPNGPNNSITNVDGKGLSVGKTFTFERIKDEAGNKETYEANIKVHYGNHTGCGPGNPDLNNTNAAGSTTPYYSVNGENTINPNYNYSCTPNSKYSYQGENGQLASTTNNVYGVYDMAGGTWDYVASNMTDRNGETASTANLNTAVFINSAKPPYVNLLEAEKYHFDLTSSSPATEDQSNNRPAWSVANTGTTFYPYHYNNDFCTWDSCGGQALHETRARQSVNAWNASWGSDYAHLPYRSNSWLQRGGRVGGTSDAGVFASTYAAGWGSTVVSSRAALHTY